MRFVLFSKGKAILSFHPDVACKDLAAILGLEVRTMAGLLNTSIALGEVKVVCSYGSDYLLRYEANKDV